MTTKEMVEKIMAPAVEPDTVTYEEVFSDETDDVEEDNDSTFNDNLWSSMTLDDNYVTRPLNPNMHLADNKIVREMVCGSNVLTEEEYRNIVLAISEYATDIVSKTLGPYGKTTNVDDSTFISPTKDGWTVLRNLRFSDPLYNSIFNAINAISFDLVTKVGDGTTSALVGANYFLHVIMSVLKDESSPLYEMRQADLLSLIDKVKDMIISSVQKSEDIYTIDVDGDFSDIYDIAYVASNRNIELSKIIQNIYQKTKNPNIYVTLDSGDSLAYKIQDGFKYDGLVLDHEYYRNSEDGTYKLDEPLLVAIFDHNVTYNEHREIISALTNYANAKHQSVLILAPYYDDIITNIMHTTISSYVQKNMIPNIIMMQVPLAKTEDRTTMSDFVLLTNAQIFDYGIVRAINVTCHNQNPANINNKIEDSLLNIKQYHFNSVQECVEQHVGRINRATIGQKYLVIQGYENVYNKTLYEQRVKEIERNYQEIARRTNKSSNMLNKDYMEAQQRYIKMLGKMGVILVGAKTELEKHCLKDSVDDAVLACRSAMNNGCVRGLNLTTLAEIYRLSEENSDLSPETKAILQLFYYVFSQMSIAVIRNRFPNDNNMIDVKRGNETISIHPSETIRYCVANNCTFDLATLTFEPQGEWKIVNSLATDTEILNSVVGVLSSLMTSDQFISLNKQYDRTINREILLEREKEKARAIEEGRLEARMKFFYEQLGNTATMIKRGDYPVSLESKDVLESIYHVLG